MVIRAHTFLDCLVYDHSKMKNQWESIADLPIGRAGGGLVYMSTHNALLYFGGAERPETTSADAFDYTDTWMYYLSDPSTGWIRKQDIPFLSNHVSYATGRDEEGLERHFFVGGQGGEEILIQTTSGTHGARPGLNGSRSRSREGTLPRRHGLRAAAFWLRADHPMNSAK